LKLRKDLWKYYEVSFHHVKDYKNQAIKKVGDCVIIWLVII
jgi:hypothetical protein